MTVQQILRAYHSLVLNDVPDDVINVIFEYAGDLKETEVDLVNRYCFYKCAPKFAEHIRCWFYNGYFCDVCDKYLQVSLRGLRRHKNAKCHRKNIDKYLKRDVKKCTEPRIRYLHQVATYSEAHRDINNGLKFIHNNIKWRH